MANNEVKVTQEGKVMPKVGDVVDVVLTAKGLAETIATGEAVQKYLVLRVGTGFGFTPLQGLMKGRVQEFKTITELVELLNSNRFIKDWSVAE